MSAERSVQQMAALRIAIGLVAWLAPNFAGRLFGLDVKHNPQAPYLARLFGVRDIVLGVGTLAAEGSERRPWLLAGLACDAADAGAAGLGHRDGYLPPATAALVAAPAVTAVAMGVMALRAPPESTA